MIASSCATRLRDCAQEGLTRKAALFLGDSLCSEPFFRIFRPQEDLCGY